MHLGINRICLLQQHHVYLVFIILCHHWTRSQHCFYFSIQFGRLFCRFPCPETQFLWGLFLLFLGILWRLHTVELIAAYAFSAACLIILQVVSWTLERMKEVWIGNTLSLVDRSLSAFNDLISSAFFLTSDESAFRLCNYFPNLNIQPPFISEKPGSWSSTFQYPLLSLEEVSSVYKCTM